MTVFSKALLLREYFATLVLLLFAIPCVGLGGEKTDWMSWRGPDGTGAIEQGAIPFDFGPEKSLWRAGLPGKGCSTPIALGASIYLTSPVDGHDAVLAFDLQGKERWRCVFGLENQGKHRNGSGSNASPVSDGTGIFVYFKSGTFAALELDGKVRWKTDLIERFGKDTLFWDHGTSPVLTSTHVIMARMHQGESWLAAFDKATGEITWKVARNFTTPTECDHGYTTPIVFPFDGKESILVWGAEHITVHDASNGNVLWSCGNFNPEGNKLWPAIASPVIIGKQVVIAYGRNDRGIPRLHGIQLSGAGDVTATNHLWKRDDVGTFVPTPSVYRGKILLVRDGGEVECIDASTGKNEWSGNFPKSRAKFYASPLIVGDLLIAPREDGIVFVARIGSGKLELLAENDMGESIIGSPIPFGNNVLLRGEKNLFCIGSNP